MVWLTFVLLAVLRAVLVSSVVVIDAWNYCNCSVSRDYHCKGLRFGSQEVSFNTSVRIYCGNVHIEDSDLYTIPKNAFLLINPCEKFAMVRCNLAQIFKWNFEGGAQTSVLNLSNNQIRIISSAVFEYLTALKELHLKDNSITTLEPNSFFGLGLLQTLHLDANFIQYIQEDMFHPLKNLTTLGLSDNQIEHLPEGIFAQNTILQYIYLHNNQLKIIDPKTPNSLVKLEDPFNSTSSAFLSLPNALSIRLSGNYLPYVGNTTFSELRNLQVFYIDRTNIAHIEMSSFNNLQKLVLLSVAENNWDTFHVSLLKPLHLLSHLELHGNKLRHFDYELLLKTINISSITLGNNSWTCAFQKDMNVFLTSAGIYTDLDRSSCVDETTSWNATPIIIGVLVAIIIFVFTILVLWYAIRRKRPTQTYIVQMKV